MTAAFLGSVFAMATLFFLAMFLGWLDATKAKDGQGFIYNRKFLVKLGYAALLAFMFEIVWWIFFGDKSEDTPKSDPLSGFIYFLVQTGLVMFAFYMQHLWPGIKAKAKEAAQKAKDEAEKGFEKMAEDWRGNGSKPEDKGPIITPPAKDPLQKARDAQKGLDEYLGKKSS